MTDLSTTESVESAVRRAVAETAIIDVHTHLFPPSHGDLLLWGVDELLTYHYLVAELFTVAPRDVTPEQFWVSITSERADLIWEHLFLKHGPLSEATRGVMTALTALGLDVGGRNLTSIRKWFNKQTIADYLPKVFHVANLDYAVMTNNPFIAEEAGQWQQDLPVPECLKAALRIDSLILDWPAASHSMHDAGYDTAIDVDVKSVREARRFLNDWAERIRPVYMAASLPPDFAYPADGRSTEVMDRIVLPTAKERGLPLAMMIGVRKQQNPNLRDGGDGVGVADLDSVLNLCQAHPDVKFLVTVLSRVNQHELCVLARKFGNLHLFGCWWFCNNPSIIEEMSRQRIELLGTAVTLQHSDARVLDQLIYKWSHTRAAVADVMAEKFRLQFDAGWRPTDEEIKRDVRAVLGGSFEEFLAK